MNELIFFFLVYILPVLFVFVAPIVIKHFDMKRTQKLLRYSRRMTQFTAFQPSLVELLRNDQQSEGYSMIHWFDDTQQGINVTTFYYGYSKGRHHYYQTAVAVDLNANQLVVPAFILREPQFADMVKERLDYIFVDLPPLEEQLSLLVFDPKTKALLETVASGYWYEQVATNSRIICDGRWFVYYHENKQIPATAEAYQRLMNQALNIVRHFNPQ